jgi:hypothetical protein
VHHQGKKLRHPKSCRRAEKAIRTHLCAGTGTLRLAGLWQPGAPCTGVKREMARGNAAV